MSGRWLMPLAAVTLTFGAGCQLAPWAGDATGFAVDVIRGCDAKATVITGCSPAVVAKYRGLTLGQVSTDVPQIVTDEVLGKVRQAAGTELADQHTLKAFPGEPPFLRCRVLVRYFKEKKFMGGDGRLDWLVTLEDAETGDSVGTIHVAGSSGSPFQHGVGDMAGENAKKLVASLGGMIVGIQ